MDNKKIAIIIPSLSMGGAERVASELANEFLKQNIDVSFILLDGNEEYYNIDEKIKKYYIEYNKNKNKFSRNLDRVRKIRKILLHESIDTVISFLTSANFLAILSTLFTSIKVFVSERSNPNISTKKIKIMRNLFYSFSNGCIFQTDEAKKCFPKYIQRKSIIIKNPIKKDLPKWDIKKEHTKEIVTACRLENSKNIPMLIDAFNKIKYKDYKLIIYGDGPEKNNIKDKIKGLNLNDRVILKGKNNNWHSYAIDMEVFVLSSNYEGMSNSLLEALAMGMPVISTDHPIGGARALIEDGVNGLLVPVNDSETLAYKLEKVISDSSLKVKLSQNALKLRDTLSINKISNEWLNFIYKISK